MGVVTAAVIGGVAALGAAKMSSDASKDAAGSAQDAANQSLSAQSRAQEIQQNNIAPYLATGNTANTTYNALLAGDTSGFTNSPDYQFNLSQGLSGLDRSAAAKGSLYSGGHSADLLNYAGGLASNQLNTYRNSLLQAMNLGQNSAVGAGSAAQGNANAVGNILSSNATAQGNASINSAGAYGGALGTLAGIASNYVGGNTSSSYAPTSTATTNYGAFQPTTGQTSYGTLAPANGSSWNFGGY